MLIDLNPEFKMKLYIRILHQIVPEQWEWGRQDTTKDSLPTSLTKGKKERPCPIFLGKAKGNEHRKDRSEYI